MVRIVIVAIAFALSGTSMAQVPEQNVGRTGQADSSQPSRLPQTKATSTPTIRTAQGTPSASVMANVAKLRSLGYWFDYKTGRWMPPTKVVPARARR